MARKLRVWRLLPPRNCRGACSSSSTLAPASRAVMAAHSAALPPPTTSTSQVRLKSIITVPSPIPDLPVYERILSHATRPRLFVAGFLSQTLDDRLGRQAGPMARSGVSHDDGYRSPTRRGLASLARDRARRAEGERRAADHVRARQRAAPADRGGAGRPVLHRVLH